jgi:hypothetical protein
MYISLSLSEEVINYVLNVVAQRPYAECAQAINEIDAQLRAAGASRADQVAKERKAEIDAAVAAKLKEKEVGDAQADQSAE